MQDVRLREIREIWKFSQLTMKLCAGCVQIGTVNRSIEGQCDNCGKYSAHLFEVRLKHNDKLWEAIDKLAKVLKW